MSHELFEVLATGMGISFQDDGRTGWKRFGVPPSGAMDRHAAHAANQMIGNPPGATVLEILWQGPKLRVMRDCFVAMTGAIQWQTTQLKAGQILEFRPAPAGLWIYLGVPGGFVAPAVLGSTSTYARAKLGRTITSGDILHSLPSPLSEGERARERGPIKPRDYSQPPPIRLWPGPQWNLFSDSDKQSFFAQHWAISPQSDRVGYRLTGTPLTSFCEQILSEPVCVGTIQIPESGLPIITMRDGPTIGGYPKLGVIDPADLDWVAQCRPGTKIRFHESGNVAMWQRRPAADQ